MRDDVPIDPRDGVADLALKLPSRKWLEFEGGVISALFQQSESALARRWRSRHEDGSPQHLQRIELEAIRDRIVRIEQDQDAKWKADYWASLNRNPSG
jgi:hypothetical protein